MTSLFGTSGVRGVTNVEITPELVVGLSQSYATLLGAGVEVATGRDTRYGAQMLEAAAIAGLTSAGARVQTCGVVPMAALAACIVRERLGGGVLITGSHMPPDRIGFILMDKDGAYSPAAVTDEVERVFGEESWVRVPFDKTGNVADALDPLGRYTRSLLEMADRERISARRFRVLTDTGNGTAGAVLPSFLRDLECDVESVNLEPKSCPDRECEPRVATLAATAQRARELGVHLTAATDIDADRVILLDENAEGIPEDVVGCILARYVLSRRKGPVVVPVNSSILIERVCREFGAPLHYCRVGQPATMEAIKKHGAVFAYEESGKYYFVNDEFWCDGILATAKFLEVMASQGATASQLASEFPKLAQVKRKISCPDELKPRVYPAVVDGLSSPPFDELDRLVELDGLKAIYKSGSWLLVRVSGTEPLVRVFAESEEPKAAARFAEYGCALVGSAIRP